MTVDESADPSLVSSYDELPYIRRAFPQTHPDRLAATATLFGLEPRSPQRCRVLELGCATGATLIPFAYYLPESEFIGVDLSRQQVAVGQAFVANLGLTNLQLHAMNLRDVPPGWGTFDYVICHGVYSWVPPEIQDCILALCACHLAPHGVAFVSYNTLPGWQLGAGLRELSLLRVGGLHDLHERLQAARAFWELIPQDLARLRSPVREALGSYLNQLAEQPDGYVSHELLEDANEPVYFHEFMARTARHGLQFLAEATVTQTAQFLLPGEGPSNPDPPPEDVTFAEQYLDILLNRGFRQTLLCPASAPVRRRVTPERLASLYLATPVKPAPAAAGNATAVFETARGERLAVPFALAQAALEVLGSRWPEGTVWPDLLERARAVIEAEPARFAAFPLGSLDRLGQFLLDAVIAGRVDVRTYAPQATLALPERPRLHALARAEAEVDIGPSTPFRDHFPLTPLTRAILLALDGDTEPVQLGERLWAAASRGTLGEKFRVLAENNPDFLRQHLAQEQDRTLRLAAQNGLYTQ